MLEEVRIEAEPEVVSDVDPETVTARSQGAAVVFQPFRLEGSEPRNIFNGPVDDVVKSLGCTVLVLASQDIALDTEPEAGRHGEIADAADASEKATKLADKAASEAEQAASEALEVRQRVASARVSGVEPENLAELEATASKADQRAEDSRRRAARLRAKAEAILREANALRGEVPGD